jgi:phosphotransferase system IIA component
MHINGLFTENIGTHLAIDEVALSGELYTIVTNKRAKGKKGSSGLLLLRQNKSLST